MKSETKLFVLMKMNSEDGWSMCDILTSIEDATERAHARNFILQDIVGITDEQAYIEESSRIFAEKKYKTKIVGRVSISQGSFN